MSLRFATALACALVATPIVPSLKAAAPAGLTLASARVSIAGTSNVHDWTAATKTVRLTAIEFAGPVTADPVLQALQPDAIEAFAIAIPVLGLTSPKDGLDKNMYKALEAEKHPDITFSLRGLAAAGAESATSVPLRATGVLAIHGVEKQVTLDIQAVRTGATLTVTGATDLLMTDYGVKAPKAMLGMVKADPKVRITFEVVLAASAQS